MGTIDSSDSSLEGGAGEGVDLPEIGTANKPLTVAPQEGPLFSRRHLLKMASMAAAGPALSSKLFASQEPLVPADKGLSPAWFKNLRRRGSPRIVTDPKALRHIGMPVGGIGCGQVYLGGDGRLWHWDIFGAPKPYPNLTQGGHYQHPMPPESPFNLEFRVGIRSDRQLSGPTTTFPLNADHFDDITFEGRYPEAKVTYRRKGLPLEIELLAQSPFVPLATDASGLPLVRMTYRVTNRGGKPAQVWLESQVPNPVGNFGGYKAHYRQIEEEFEVDGWQGLICHAATPDRVAASTEPIPLAKWQDGTYGGWKAEGTAFGPGPVDREKLPERLSPARPLNRYFVNTHEARRGEDSPTADRHVGTLTSPPFRIERRYLNFWIGGGNHPGETCLNLLVDGKIVCSETGRDSSVLRGVSWDLRDLAGKQAILLVVDRHTGGWGHVSLDDLHLSDAPLPPPKRPEEMPDFGSIAIAGRLSPSSWSLREEEGGRGVEVPPFWTAETLSPLCSADSVGAPPAASQSYHSPSSWSSREEEGGRGVEVEADLQNRFPAVPPRFVFDLAPGDSRTVEFLIAWHFPNYGDAHAEMRAIKDFDKLKRYYSKRFRDAQAVLLEAIAKRDPIFGTSRLWTDTWYDSTLPPWFLERTLLPIDCLQTATAHRFDNGRFYGWEGIYCCAGTCQHVWNYAQAVGRLFPELERDTRERVDYGIAYHEDGTLGYRAETSMHIAHDGQAGTILRTWREHTMCADDKFLKRLWPRIKKSIQRLIADDKDRDGILEGWQYNTLDSGWYGEIAWISSLYLAALQAGVAMAEEMLDDGFALELKELIRRGRRNMKERLFNGEYFIQKRDPAHPEAPGHGIGCHIDQVFGDSFLHMVGLDPVLDRETVRTALRSLWQYNFVPDAGAYRKKIAAVIPGGRWYAMDKEAGLLMTTFPKGGAEDAPGKGNPTWMVGYFNECMNGFEYQVAAHMIAEGMVDEGLAVVKALDERYDAAKRNPYNEIECSDHYSRSMAAYGAFISACGFAYHGPRGQIRFGPKVSPENFKAAFTVAEGWGSYEQRIRGAEGQRTLEASVTIKFGQLRLTQVELELPEGFSPSKIQVERGNERIDCFKSQSGRKLAVGLIGNVVLTLESPVLRVKVSE